MMMDSALRRSRVQTFSKLEVRLCRLWGISLLLCLGSGLGLAGTQPAHARVLRADLTPSVPSIGMLFSPQDHAVEVVVEDLRTAKDFIGAGPFGLNSDQGRGTFMGYATPREEDLAEFMASAGRDAVRVVGLRVGEGHRLRLKVHDYFIDLYQYSGYSPMNCFGYGRLEAILEGPNGKELSRRSFRPTGLETTYSVVSMKEVGREAMSRLVQQAVWAAVASTLIDHFEPRPDSARIASLYQQAGRTDEAVEARQTLFWLALTGHVDSDVELRLGELLGSQEQWVHQAAAEAVGRLAIDSMTPDLRGVLAGKRVGGWDIEDLEQVWYLVRSLIWLGVNDPDAEVTSKIRHRKQLKDLQSFLGDGLMPKLSAAMAKKRQAQQGKLESKRRKWRQ